MGQYYRIINIDTKEYLNPTVFGDGIKLMEFGASGEGVLTALTILLADGNNRGGGDFRYEHPLIGSWAGHRIVISGDYADKGCFGVPESQNLYDYIYQKYSGYKDISVAMRAVIEAGEPGMLAEPWGLSITQKADLAKQRKALGIISEYIYEPASSSAITRLEYHSDTNQFTVTFNSGHHYTYHVDGQTDGLQLFEAAKSAPSLGRFYHSTLKPCLIKEVA